MIIFGGENHRSSVIVVYVIDIYVNYVVHNEMLDREFTLQEIDGAIKHLKSGKAAGSDDIKSEYISYENKQLKPV